MSFRSAILMLTSTVILSFLPSVNVAAMNEAKKAQEQKGEPDYFITSNNVMRDVDATLAKARKNDKLALVILGADWCHDSRALASRLKDPKLKTLIDENYETAIVDVDFFDYGVDVAQRFGQQTIFATPTVFVIDPETETVVNAHTMHRWRDADAISMEDTISYFDQIRDEDNQTTPVTAGRDPLLARMLAEIRSFEKKQSRRIEEGFSVMVPYLKMSRSERPKEFYSLWMELRGLRYNITRDLVSLRQRAVDTAKAGKDITLVYPVYNSFSWE